MVIIVVVGVVVVTGFSVKTMRIIRDVVLSDVFITTNVKLKVPVDNDSPAKPILIAFSEVQ